MSVKRDRSVKRDKEREEGQVDKRGTSEGGRVEIIRG